MNVELGRIWIETVVGMMEVISRNLTERLRKITGNLSQEPASRPKLESSIARIQVFSATVKLARSGIVIRKGQRD
jgi:hypothetical protein